MRFQSTTCCTQIRHCTCSSINSRRSDHHPSLRENNTARNPQGRILPGQRSGGEGPEILDNASHVNASLGAFGLQDHGATNGALLALRTEQRASLRTERSHAQTPRSPRAFDGRRFNASRFFPSSERIGREAFEAGVHSSTCSVRVRRLPFSPRIAGIVFVVPYQMVVNCHAPGS